MSATAHFIGGPADGDYRALKTADITVKFLTVKGNPFPLKEGDTIHTAEIFYVREPSSNADGSWNYHCIPEEGQS
jgi:hypothetical protein